MSSHPSFALPCLAVGTALKLLLLPAYRSTDFEVHRNWLAITSSLPCSQWYVYATSEWTLDYPPFFAYFERALAVFAPLFDPQMLVVSAQPYASAPTVVYQRLTVIVTDVLLLIGASRMVRDATAPLTPLALTFLNAGLLLVDHVHFQYNGFLIGLFLLVVANIRSGDERTAAALFGTRATELEPAHLRPSRLRCSRAFPLDVWQLRCSTSSICSCSPRRSYSCSCCATTSCSRAQHRPPPSAASPRWAPSSWPCLR